MTLKESNTSSGDCCKLYKYTFVRDLLGRLKDPKVWRILSKPHDQGTAPTCPCHAIVKTLESKYRIALKAGILKPEYQSIPNLSVQHMIDQFDWSDAKKALNSVLKLLKTTGVTTENRYPYHGYPRKVKRIQKKWKVYKAAGFRDYIYKLDKREPIQQLMDSLDERSTFGVRYIMYDSHDKAKPGDILRKEGNMKLENKLPVGHLVQVIGYQIEWSKEEGKWVGFWRFLNSWGIGWGKKGKGKLDIELVFDIVLVKLPPEVYIDGQGEVKLDYEYEPFEEDEKAVIEGREDGKENEEEIAVFEGQEDERKEEEEEGGGKRRKVCGKMS